MSFEIDISIRTDGHEIDAAALKSALQHGLRIENVASAVLSVTIVDNATIHQLNRQHLGHDYPTDVISFQLSWRSPRHDDAPRTPANRSEGAEIEGEIIVSAEYGREMAVRCGWKLQNELTLYAIHGMLHICGYDDLTPAEKGIMRSRELAVLSGLGMTPSWPVDVEDEPPEVTAPDPSDVSAEDRR